MADYKEETLDELIEANEPEAEEQPEPKEKVEEPEPEEEQPDEPATVPLAALHKERDKRKADAERLELLEKELQELKTPKQEAQEQVTAPDMFEDPEGYNAYWESRLSAVQQTNQQQLINERLNISERYAAKEHGAEAVEEVKGWFAERVKTNPGFQMEVVSQPDPYEFAIQEMRKEQFASSVTPEDFAAFQQWRNSQGEAPLQAPSTTANRASKARKTPEPFDADEALEDILKQS